MKDEQNGVCQEIKPDGAQCKARPLTGSSFCFFHEPSKARARLSAQRAGGIARIRGSAEISDGTPDRPLETGADGIALLAEVVNKVLKGKLKPKVGAAIGYLLNVFFRAHAQCDLEARLKVLEEVYEAQRSAAGYQDVPAWTGEQFDFQMKSEGANDEKS
jgi:hypothetical protein